MRVLTSIDSGEVNFKGKHVLFVEGDANSLDVSALSSLLDITVKPLGSCAYVRSVAQAMHPAFPNYYFLVDRDRMEDEDVEQLWQNFPNADTPNLLAWRKKEIESNFIDPEYVVQSKCFAKGKTVADVRKRLVNFAQSEVYMAAANRVIISIREKLKRKWVEKFDNKNDFVDADAALRQLLSVRAFRLQVEKLKGLVSEEKLVASFKRELRLLLGDGDRLVWGKGRWLDLMPAKGMMKDIFGSPLFKVLDRNKKPLQGKNKIDEIVKELVSPSKTLPSDFIELQELIKVQVERNV